MYMNYNNVHFWHIVEAVSFKYGHNRISQLYNNIISDCGMCHMCFKLDYFES